MTLLQEKAKELEHYETPLWAAQAILRHESFPPGVVLDPCTGTGILARTAVFAGYEFVSAMDIHDWKGAYPRDELVLQDFLEWQHQFTEDFSIFMNPPFSKACEFVEKSLELGARKVVCFQRFAWWESLKRKPFWEKNPPARVYVCGERATCWRHDVPDDQRTPARNTPTAHAWFVWEGGAPNGTLLGHIWKEDVKC